MLIVAAAALARDGRFLLQQRPPGKSLPGLWEFPGGKVEPGESPEDALARELAEELGIVVDPASLCPLTFAGTQVETGPLLLLLYLCSEWEGEPKALHATAIAWATPEAMCTILMPPADAPFIDCLAALQARNR